MSGEDLAWDVAVASDPKKLPQSQPGHRTVTTGSFASSKPYLQDEVQVLAWTDFDDSRSQILSNMSNDSRYKDVIVPKADVEGSKGNKPVGAENDVLWHFDAALMVPRIIFDQTDKRLADGQQRQPMIGSWSVLQDEERKATLGTKALDSCILVKNCRSTVFLLECKTDWNDPFLSIGGIFSEDAKEKADALKDAQKYCGQLVEYLLKTGLRYGCITNYKETVYVRLDEDGDVLEVYLSPIVFADTSKMSEIHARPPGVSRLTFYQSYVATMFETVYNDVNEPKIEHGVKKTETLLTIPSSGKPSSSKKKNR